MDTPPDATGPSPSQGFTLSESTPPLTIQPDPSLLQNSHSLQDSHSNGYIHTSSRSIIQTDRPPPDTSPVLTGAYSMNPGSASLMDATDRTMIQTQMGSQLPTTSSEYNSHNIDLPVMLNQQSGPTLLRGDITSQIQTAVHGALKGSCGVNTNVNSMVGGGVGGNINVNVHVHIHSTQPQFATNEQPLPYRPQAVVTRATPQNKSVTPCASAESFKSKPVKEERPTTPDVICLDDSDGDKHGKGPDVSNGNHCLATKTVVPIQDKSSVCANGQHSKVTDEVSNNVNEKNDSSQKDDSDTSTPSDQSGFTSQKPDAHFSSQEINKESITEPPQQMNTKRTSRNNRNSALRSQTNPDHLTSKKRSLRSKSIVTSKAKSSDQQEDVNVSKVSGIPENDKSTTKARLNKTESMLQSETIIERCIRKLTPKRLAVQLMDVSKSKSVSFDKYGYVDVSKETALLDNEDSPDKTRNRKSRGSVAGSTANGSMRAKRIRKDEVLQTTGVNKMKRPKANAERRKQGKYSKERRQAKKRSSTDVAHESATPEVTCVMESDDDNGFADENCLDTDASAPIPDNTEAGSMDRETITGSISKDLNTKNKSSSDIFDSSGQSNAMRSVSQKPPDSSTLRTEIEIVMAEFSSDEEDNGPDDLTSVDNVVQRLDSLMEDGNDLMHQSTSESAPVFGTTTAPDNKMESNLQNSLNTHLNSIESPHQTSIESAPSNAIDTPLQSQKNMKNALTPKKLAVRLTDIVSKDKSIDKVSFNKHGYIDVAKVSAKRDDETLATKTREDESLQKTNASRRKRPKPKVKRTSNQCRHSRTRQAKKRSFTGIAQESVSPEVICLIDSDSDYHDDGIDASMGDSCLDTKTVEPIPDKSSDDATNQIKVTDSISIDVNEFNKSSQMDTSDILPPTDQSNVMRPRLKTPDSAYPEIVFGSDHNELGATIQTNAQTKDNNDSVDKTVLENSVNADLEDQSNVDSAFKKHDSLTAKANDLMHESSSDSAPTLIDTTSIDERNRESNEKSLKTASTQCKKVSTPTCNIEPTSRNSRTSLPQSQKHFEESLRILTPNKPVVQLTDIGKDKSITFDKHGYVDVAKVETLLDNEASRAKARVRNGKSADLLSCWVPLKG